MVRDKNNNDRLIRGNMDSCCGASSSSSKLCPVYPIEINHRIAFCPQLHTFKICRNVVQRLFLKHVNRRDNTTTKY